MSSGKRAKGIGRCLIRDPEHLRSFAKPSPAVASCCSSPSASLAAKLIPAPSSGSGASARC
jgi:hypothetical protein